MSRWLAPVLWASCVCASAPVSASTLELTDDRGKRFAFDEPVRRIVTLAPHLSEIVFAAGAGRALAGVSSASDFPEEARTLPVVASHGRADAERIAATRPDLVMGWLSGTPRREVERLEKMGLRVFMTEVRTLDDIPRLVRAAGSLAGTADAAGLEARALEARIAALLPRGAGVSVFVEIWHRPLMTVNGAHLISDVLRRCGGRNVFDDAGALSFAVSRERLLQARPQVIVANGEEARTRWPGARVHAVDPRLMHSQGPRVLGVAEDLCARLAP